MSRVTLWTRAGADGVRVGGDPTSHAYFLLLLWKSEHDKDLVFDVKTVVEAKPPVEFKQLGVRHAPALQVDEDAAFSHDDEIMQFLERFQPNDRCEEAEDVTSDLFRQFAFFIKDIKKEPTNLMAEFRRIDSFLGSSGQLYLRGNDPSEIDCLILTRLHSIRIAAKYFRDLEIPSDMIHLWNYLERAYRWPHFVISCPADQEIILHWADRPGVAPLANSKRGELSRQQANYTRERSL